MSRGVIPRPADTSGFKFGFQDPSKASPSLIDELETHALKSNEPPSAILPESLEWLSTRPTSTSHEIEDATNNLNDTFPHDSPAIQNDGVHVAHMMTDSPTSPCS